MLVLTARKDKIIYIGDDIAIHVKGISQGQVKLGFVAPRDVNIVRGDVLDREEAKNRVEPITTRYT